MAPEPIIRLVGITKTYTTGEVEVHALVDVDLTVEKGEMVAIMGPSGSGKSTLMNVLGCLDRPTKGSYRFEGREVATLQKRELSALRLSAFGFVFQGFQLIARTSALDNVALPLVYAGVPAEERRKRAKEALGRVGLAGREEHTSAQLSGGQQQRVAIARALVNRPRLILADEPTGALDTRTSVEVLGLLQSLHKSGITIVIVTHEPDIAAYADRRLVVRDGRILSDERQAPRDAAADLAAIAARRPRERARLHHPARVRRAPAQPDALAAHIAGSDHRCRRAHRDRRVRRGLQGRSRGAARDAGDQPLDRASRLEHARRSARRARHRQAAHPRRPPRDRERGECGPLRRAG